MSPELFRKWLIAIAATFALGFLLIAMIFTWGILIIGSQWADNGRYLQYDQQKDALVRGESSVNGLPKLLDTRSGEVQLIGQSAK